MWFLLALAGLEALVMVAGPLQAVLATRMEFSAESAAAWSYELLVYVVLTQVGLVMMAAWLSVREGNVLDHVAYVAGMGLLLSHLIRRIEVYDAFYVILGGKGDLAAEGLILFVYVLLPFGAMLVPLLSIPFALIVQERAQARIREYFGGWQKGDSNV